MFRPPTVVRARCSHRLNTMAMAKFFGDYDWKFLCMPPNPVSESAVLQFVRAFTFTLSAVSQGVRCFFGPNIKPNLDVNSRCFITLSSATGCSLNRMLSSSCCTRPPPGCGAWSYRTIQLFLLRRASIIVSRCRMCMSESKPIHTADHLFHYFQQHLSKFAHRGNSLVS